MRHRFDLKNLPLFVENLRRAVKGMEEPMSFSIVERFGRDPFLILISCLLSLRTRDTVTLPISLELFKRVHTPEQMVAISLAELESIIYSVGFYKRKAVQLKAVSAILLSSYSGKVPHTEKELLALPGVGIKTANLVLGIGFMIPAICVDIHVHRISNKLGIVATKTPEQTEQALKKVLPRMYWIEWNRLLVMWGQNMCKPTAARCSQCGIMKMCDEKGVVKVR